MPIDHKRWINLAAETCAHAGVDPGTIEIVVTWDEEYCANAVYRLGSRRFLKLFGPDAAWQFQIERCLLTTLAGHDVIPAPRLLAAGDRTEQPPYLIVTAMPGATAEHAWDDLPRPAQLALAAEIGTITAAIHALPQENLTAVERRWGGKERHVSRYQARWRRRIGEAESLSRQQRDELLAFLQGEALDLMNELPTLTHYDLAHNHIYLAQEEGVWRVSGLIDWAEAVLGPAEWDVAYLWFWTFSGDRGAMRACLDTLYAGRRPPDRFARRCLAAIFHTSSMGLLWSDFDGRSSQDKSVVRAMTAFYFPEILFGPPD